MDVVRRRFRPCELDKALHGAATFGVDGLLGGYQRQGVLRVGGRRDEAGGSRLYPERVGSGQEGVEGFFLERYRPARYREGGARRGLETYIVQRKRSLALGMDGGGDGDGG